MANVAKTPKDLRNEIKTLKAEVKKLTADAKAAAKLHKTEVSLVTEQAYNAGFEDGFNESIEQQAKLEEEFDKHMEKAAVAFEKQFAANNKKAHVKKKKTTTKKATTKKTGAKKAPAKKSTGKRGRPRKNAAAK